MSTTIKKPPAEFNPLAGRAAPRPAPAPGHRYADANAQVVIAGVEALPRERHERARAVAQLVPTDDPADRAHRVRDRVHGLLLPAGAVPASQTTPRRYPPCHIVERATRAGVRRIALDSVYDRTYEIARELAEAGIELGVVGAAVARERAERGRSGTEMGRRTRPNAYARLSRAQIEMEREGSRLLRK